MPGTAHKPDNEHGGYRPGAYVDSVIGYATASRPAVVVAVIIDEPTNGYYGGSVAAPVFPEVTSTALRRLAVVPKPLEPALHRRGHRTSSFEGQCAATLEPR